jgi:hypothetical protein
MAKFTLDQNNAGGFYLAGTPEISVIEAKTLDEAIAIAKTYGIDFDDACVGCCGERWQVVPYEKWHGENLPDFVEWMLAPIG